MEEIASPSRSHRSRDRDRIAIASSHRDRIAREIARVGVEEISLSRVGEDGDCSSGVGCVTKGGDKCWR